MLAKLTRITAAGAMRTKSITGICQHPPTIGHPFVIMNNEPLVKESGDALPNDSRIVNTSRVMWTQTQFEGGLHFQTESGTDYLYEEIDANP